MDQAIGTDDHIITNLHALQDRDIAADPGTFPDLHILMDDTERVNLYIRGQFGIGVYISMGMNHLIEIRQNRLVTADGD